MIISHEYNFIFIKTSKTAGTSVEIALSKFCGAGDIITPISPADEKLRRKLGYRGPQNYIFSAPEDLDPLPPAGRPCPGFRNHDPARKIRRCIGDIVWNSYYKFAFERNPWDRFLSFYYYRCRKQPSTTIAEFLTPQNLKRLKGFGSKLYTINGKIAVDRLCRYENLEEELEAVRQRLGIPEALELPQAKSTYRPDQSARRRMLTEEQVRQIGDYFQEEIDRFAYKYEGGLG